MNYLMKLNEVYQSHELTLKKQELVDNHKIDYKILSIIDSISSIGNAYSIYTFWDKQKSIDKEEAITHFTFALKTLMSLAYDLSMDSFKEREEIPTTMHVEDVIFQIYSDLINLRNTHHPISLENAINDIFLLANQLNIQIDTILDTIR